MAALDEVKIGTQVCDYCAEPAVAEMFHGRVRFVCGECGSFWSPRFSGLNASVENGDSHLNLPEDVVNETLKRKCLETCFGQMEVRYNRRIDADDEILPDDCSAPEEAYREVVEKQVNEAKAFATKIVRCKSCGLFNRCAVLSGLRV